MPRVPKFVGISLAACVAITVMATRGAEPPDLAPVRQWIAHATAVKSLTVEFTQERRLKALNKPLISTGRLWFRAPGALRWQVGEPPKLIALQRERGGECLVIEPSERTARICPPDAAQKRSDALAFLDASFPVSLDAFQEKFRITAVERVDGCAVVTGHVTDRRMAVAVLKVMFRIDDTTHGLREFEIDFRDGSSITNRFTKTTENAALPAALFDENLEGYKVITEK